MMSLLEPSIIVWSRDREVIHIPVLSAYTYVEVPACIVVVRFFFPEENY